MTADHPLDRPVWASLTTRQSGLALGNARAVRLDPDYGVFVAAADDSAPNLAALGALVRAEGEAGMVEAGDWPAIHGVIAQPPVTLCQMVAGDLKGVAPGGFDVVDLTAQDGSEMFDLARLTQPGPFFGRTHRLGDFVGVRQGGRLVAMAGERMKLPGFTEVSAVCTHPDHRGHGYAAALTAVVSGRIEARGETPFLHVYPHNLGAIRLYEQLGYAIRREMKFTLLSPA
ncbi:GNAT family N-acetyltransferase [uncultured Phenylobacterium sp.]|uniref:GNAT family N-acetyltransferase n=1 Tax=uncultured Phenylobacterium sp. TaxID=349273 RepID=UPI0025FB0842|nr:GNAT family N-acetyltransferase [uncultured Phenylobacterium sp.]